MIDMYAGEYSALLSAFLKVRQWKTIMGREKEETKSNQRPSSAPTASSGQRKRERNILRLRCHLPNSTAVKLLLCFATPRRSIALARSVQLDRKSYPCLQINLFWQKTLLHRCSYFI